MCEIIKVPFLLKNTQNDLLLSFSAVLGLMFVSCHTMIFWTVLQNQKSVVGLLWKLQVVHQ